MIGIFKLSLWLNYKEDYSQSCTETNPDLFPQITCALFRARVERST